jgi:hypothetical protein
MPDIFIICENVNHYHCGELETHTMGSVNLGYFTNKSDAEDWLDHLADYDPYYEPGKYSVELLPQGKQFRGKIFR